MEKLAIFGGTPVREGKSKIFYGHQCVDEKDIEAVCETLRSEALTCGPKVTELEKRLCDITDAKYAVSVSNGTAALHVACMAIGLQPGDEVIVSSITFAASANCVRYMGATVVFADVCKETYNIDPDDVLKKITPKTKAVIAVDYTGQAVELDRLMKICKEHNLYLIEDGAHSIGTLYDGKPVGSIADITTFSFHPVKTVTSGEGGACMTNDEALYKKLKLASTHGITKDRSMMVNKTDDPWYYEEISLGYNYRLSDIQCALLLSQLDKLSFFSKRRKEIAAMYEKAFEGDDRLFLQKTVEKSDSTRHIFVIRINPDKLSCTRREFFDALAAEGTVPQVHYIPVYYLPYYQDLGYKKGLCPVAEAIYENIVSIPFYPAMTDEDVNDTITSVRKVLDYYTK